MQQIKRCEKVNRKNHSEKQSATTTTGKGMHTYCGNSADVATSVKVSHLQKIQAKTDHDFRVT